MSGDVRGGLTAGLVTLVTTMAHATVGGTLMGADLATAAALSGLIGVAVGGVVATLTGTLDVQVHMPRASVVLLVASAGVAIAAQLGPGSTVQTLAWTSLCTLLAALLQAAFGVLRLGALIRLVPRSVTAGFAVGIALQLAWMQRKLLWPGPAWPVDTVVLAPLAIGTATVIAIVWMQWQRVWKLVRAWAVPLGFVLGVALCAALEAAATAAPLAVARLQAIDLEAGPLVSLRRVFDLEVADINGAASAAAVLPRVLLYAFVIAFVNALETLTCALTLEARLQQRFDANRALIASALGSLASVCAGGLPVAGSPASSNANIDAGAKTRSSALLAAGAVGALTLAGRGALPWIPLAALAGVTLTVAWGMGWRPARELLLAGPRARTSGPAALVDLAVAGMVVALLLAAGGAVALLSGVLVASLLALLQLRRGVVARSYLAPGAPTAAIRVIEIGQPLLFANVEPVVQAIEAQAGTDARFVVVDLTQASAVDASAARTLADCGLAMSVVGQTLVLVRPASATARCARFDGCLAFDRIGDAIGHGVDVLRAQPAPAVESDAQRAVRLLLPHVGPIAPILARRAEARATSIDEFYRLLGEELPGARAREAFMGAVRGAAARHGRRGSD